MPEINKYAFKHKELVELLIKASDIHEGRWWLSVTFQMAPGNFGQTEEDVSPGMIVAIQSVGIEREAAGNPAPTSLVVDAAEVNPAPAISKTSRVRKREAPTKTKSSA